MLAALFLIGSALLGAFVVRRVARDVSEVWEQALWGLVSGWMLGTLAAYGVARWQGRLTWGAVAWATLFVWALLAFVSARWLTRPRRVRLKSFGLADAAGRAWFGLAAVLFVFAPLLWKLFSTHTFAEGAGGVYSGGSAWYDLSFHAALASSFAYGENFPPAYTPLAGETLRYPFLPDFHAAALMAAGLSMRAAFLTTALPLALALVGIFYGFALRLARTSRAAALATCLFLLNGGLGFLNLYEDWRASGRTFAEFWDALPFNYANDWARGIHWTNLVADTLIPQRAALYGLPAGLLILTLFAAVRERWCAKAEPPSVARRLLLAAGVLAGVLPLFHMHSYIAVGFLSVVLFLSAPRREWLWFWVPAVFLASPQLFELWRHAPVGQIVRWQPGWMGADAPSLAVYLLRNFGLPLVLAVPAWLAAPRACKVLYVATLLLLIFALTVVISPNVFDNSKLTYYWHAANSALVARWLVSRARARRLRVLLAPLALLLTLLSLATGVAALRAEAQSHALLFTEADIKAAQFVREGTPPRARFLTAPTFNHAVLALAGRAVVRGPTDWLWAHGYEFRAREADVRGIYAGAPDALELLSYYGVDYVYLGETERRELRADAAFFDSNLHAVYRAGDVAIYQVNSAADDGAKHTPAPRELAARVGRDPFALVEQFPRVGFFVHEILKADFGRAPTRDEFMQALRELGRDLYVGREDWVSRVTENGNKLATRLAGGDRARADRLLAAAHDPHPEAREYDEAYVRAHFFAYLGRDPDPDGLNFWLGVLSRNRDYRSLSRAFMESEEYKRK